MSSFSISGMFSGRYQYRKVTGQSKQPLHGRGTLICFRFLVLSEDQETQVALWGKPFISMKVAVKLLLTSPSFQAEEFCFLASVQRLCCAPLGHLCCSSLSLCPMLYIATASQESAVQSPEFWSLNLHRTLVTIRGDAGSMASCI